MHEGFVLLLKCPFGQFVLWIFNFNGALYIVLSVLLYSRSKFLLWVLVNLIRILVPYWFFGGLVQKLTIEVWKKKSNDWEFNTGNNFVRQPKLPELEKHCFGQKKIFSVCCQATKIPYILFDVHFELLQSVSTLTNRN